MILTEKHIDNRKISSLVGPPIPQKWTKLKTIGGPGLFLKKFVNKTGGSQKLKLDSRCNLEKRPKGLLVHTNHSNKRTLIPLPFDDILQLKIVRGKEFINPRPLYPMWILMKLGVSVLKARYLAFRVREYAIDPTEFQLCSKNYDFKFMGNGFDFERMLEFLQSLPLEDKLIIKSCPK